MSTLDTPAPATPSDPAPTGERIIDGALLPIAAELAGTVRDYGPDTIRDLLNRVPDDEAFQHTPGGRYGALCVVLAAMVDPDQPVSRLLGWLNQPVRSRDGVEPSTSGIKQCRDCGQWMRTNHYSRHRKRWHAESSSDAQQAA